MASPVHPRLANLLASFALNLTDEVTTALADATGLTGSATHGLLALDEFLGGTHVGHLAEVLGLTHSGAVRLVTQLEAAGLARRRAGADRRRVEVRLTPRGRRRAAAARAAHNAVVRQATSALNATEAAALENLLAKLIETKVAARVQARLPNQPAPWWCRTCDFTACGRPEGRCPAQTTAREHTTPDDADTPN